MLIDLNDLDTELSTGELLAEMVPPSEFSKVSFDSYIPDPRFESQSQALVSASTFSRDLGGRKKGSSGIYLDGGFGVGKTHLLASIYHSAKVPKIYGSFLAFTSSIGYLGFANSISEFSKFKLLCIDEFELDDPGDTMIMSRFLKELSQAGACFAATSNTPPNALGQGRFAADNFQREISSVADRFQMVRIDGEDYRHRGLEYSFNPIGLDEKNELIASSQRVLSVSQAELLGYLASVHQSKYSKLAEQFDVLILDEVMTIQDQFAGIRMVSFVDRIYEAGILFKFSSGSPSQIFREDHLLGAYQKKYRRALSRLAAMATR